MTEKLKKEIKKPDPFQTFTAGVMGCVAANKKSFLIGAAAAFAVVVIAAGWIFYRTADERNAQKLYAQAQAELRKGIPESPESSQKALKIYQEVTTKHPGTRSAGFAWISMGNLHYRQGDYDSAIRDYEEFLKQSDPGNELRTVAYSSLGYCYESKKDYKKALENFEQSGKHPLGSAYAAASMNNIARIHEAMNNREQALTYYKKALESKSDPILDALIKRKISELS